MPALPGSHASAAAVAAAEAAYYNNGMQGVHPSALGHFVRQPVRSASPALFLIAPGRLSLNSLLCSYNITSTTRCRRPTRGISRRRCPLARVPTRRRRPSSSLPHCTSRSPKSLKRLKRRR